MAREPVPTMVVVMATLLFVVAMVDHVSGRTMFLELKNKFAGRTLGESMVERFQHDTARMQRELSAVDVHLGALKYWNVGIFFAKLMIGKPAVAYYPHLDIRSDLTWLYCKDCKTCPATSTMKNAITHYDAEASSGSKKVTCDDENCKAVKSNLSEICPPGDSCKFQRAVDDGGIIGHLVEDVMTIEAVTGNNKSSLVTADVTFGCGMDGFGRFGTTYIAMDGVIGFGRSNVSLLAQLVSQKLVKNSFAFCLDTHHDGGIFAIGEVNVEEKIPTVPLLPDKPDDRILVKGVDYGDTPVIKSDVSKKDGVGIAYIAVDVNFIYLPVPIFKSFMTKLKATHKSLKFVSPEPYTCFLKTGTSEDTNFPSLTFYFHNSLKVVIPREVYMFDFPVDQLCIGIFSSASVPGHEDEFVIGENALTGKLIVLDYEKDAIGWINYNCSDGVKVKDEKTEMSFKVDQHNTSMVPMSSATVVRGTPLLFIVGSMLSWFMF